MQNNFTELLGGVVGGHRKSVFTGETSNNRRHQVKNWVALTMVAALTGTALAQTESSTKKKPPVKQSQPTQEAAKPAPVKPPVIKFTMAMLESGRIDPGYVGFAAADVIEALEKMTVSKKGEFESTADYNARKAADLPPNFWVI